MEDTNTIREILSKYYSQLSKGDGWQPLLSEDIVLTGTVAKETKGKDAYVNNTFFKLIRGLKVKRMIVGNDSACALVNYDLVSPKGKSFTCDVSEIWSIKSGKLDSLAIYFDTAAFHNFMS
jgi:ketosteroid isomerase-like protein